MGLKRQALAAQRLEQGYTQEDLAQMLGVSVGTVGRWEAGRGDPWPRFLPPLRRALKVSPERLRQLLDRTVECGQVLDSGEDVASTRSDLIERTALLSKAGVAIAALAQPYRHWLDELLAPRSAAAVRVGASDILRVRSMVDWYRVLDNQYGGGLVVDSVGVMARQAEQLVPYAGTGSVRSDLQSAIGELRALAGWTAFDAGEHTEARTHFRAAEHLATAADEPSLLAFIRYCQARQLQHLRCDRDAVDVLRQAGDQLRSRATPAATAMLHATLAPSLAALGHRDVAVAALADAQHSFDTIDHSTEPSWLSWLDEPELLAQYGRVYRDFARSDRSYAPRAVEWTQRALSGFGGGMARSRALTEIGLCSAMFLDGSVEYAVAIGHRLPAEATTLTSQRVREHITNLPRDATPYRRRATVADLTRALTNLPSSSLDR